MEFRSPLARGRFLRRLNRFAVLVDIEGVPRPCHLPNPGRLEELLVPGAEVLLLERRDGKRNTSHDLAAVSHLEVPPPFPPLPTGEGRSILRQEPLRLPP